MKSAIRQILYGDRDRASLKISKRHQEILGEIADAQKLLLTKLSPEAVGIFHQVDGLNGEMLCETEDAHYTEGFKFGFLIALEILDK